MHTLRKNSHIMETSLIKRLHCTEVVAHMLDLKLSNESWQIQFPLVVGEEVPALSYSLGLQSSRESLAIFTMLLNHCREEGRGGGHLCEGGCLTK